MADSATLAAPSPAPPQRRRSRRRIIRRLLRDPAAAAGAVVITLGILGAVVGPMLAPHDPNTIYPTHRLAGPSGEFWLGTDQMGRDLFSRMLSGARISLSVAGSSVALAAAVGVFIGMIAGFRRGVVDGILMRAMDILFGFPAILLALLTVALLGSAVRNLVIALAIVYIPAFARIARASTMAVAAEPFVEAARSIAASGRRVLWRHIAPNIVAPVIVQFTVSLAYAVVVEASLSFLGLGVQPPTASWGNMLSTGKPFLEVSFWPSVVPGVALFFTVLGFNLLGDGLRDVLDPRLRGAVSQTER
jgi:peptide/nickel transport system permease protein